MDNYHKFVNYSLENDHDKSNSGNQRNILNPKKNSDYPRHNQNRSIPFAEDVNAPDCRAGEPRAVQLEPQSLNSASSTSGSATKEVSVAHRMVVRGRKVDNRIQATWQSHLTGTPISKRVELFTTGKKMSGETLAADPSRNQVVLKNPPNVPGSACPSQGSYDVSST